MLATWPAYAHMHSVALIILWIIFSRYESNRKYRENFMSTKIFHPTMYILSPRNWFDDCSNKMHFAEVQSNVPSFLCKPFSHFSFLVPAVHSCVQTSPSYNKKGIEFGCGRSPIFIFEQPRVSLIPRAHPAFRCLQYGRAWEPRVTFTSLLHERYHWEIMCSELRLQT